MSLEGKSQDEISALAELSDSLLSNPKTRQAFQRQLKVANPNISLPELDNLDMVANAVRPHIDKIAQLEQREQQRDANQSAQLQANALYEALKDDGVVATRKDFQELVKYASENGFQTVENGLRIAASHRQSASELATPTPMQGAGPEFAPTNEAYKDFFKNPRKAATDIANQMVNDIKSGKAKYPAQANQQN